MSQRANGSADNDSDRLADIDAVALRVLEHKGSEPIVLVLEGLDDAQAAVGFIRPPCEAGVIRAAPVFDADLSQRRKRLTLTATIFGSSMAFVDGSVVNIALPAIQHALHAAAATTQWMVNAYLLLLGAMVLIGGAAADLYGRRRIFLLGIAVFTAAAITCGPSSSAD